jgi:hypothetical protein
MNAQIQVEDGTLEIHLTKDPFIPSHCWKFIENVDIESKSGGLIVVTGDRVVTGHRGNFTNSEYPPYILSNDIELLDEDCYHEITVPIRKWGIWKTGEVDVLAFKCEDNWSWNPRAWFKKRLPYRVVSSVFNIHGKISGEWE